MLQSARRVPWRLILCLLVLSAIELRFLPLPTRAATITVTTCADSGSGSLRAAISAAASGDTIGFTPGLNCSDTGAGPIALTSGILTLGTSLTIDGTGATIVVDGNGLGSVFTVNGEGLVTLNGLTIQHGSGNACFDTSFCGGGIDNNGGTLTVTNSTITNNAAMGPSGRGGGIDNNGGTLTVTNSTFSGNSAGNGGGIGDDGNLLRVTNSTFSGNSALSGGGIFLILGNSASVTNSTFSGNSATVGGGIFGGLNDTVTLTNTIVANSTSGGDLAASPGSPEIPAKIYTGNNNLIGDGSGGLNPANGNLLGTPENPLNPLLAPLGNYGGPTQTFALLPGSPAIDAGAAVSSGPAGATVPAADQRGIARPQGAGVDIGAFETRFILTVSGGNPQTAAVSHPFATPLTVTFGGPDAPADKSGAAVTFTAPGSGASATFNGNPATTNASGVASVTATANGITGAYSVTATTPGAAAVTFTLTNTNPLMAITVTPANGTVKVGQVQQYVATGAYADSTTVDLTTQVVWSSDAGTVARVDAKGKVTGLTPGSAHVTATQGSVSGQASMTVSAGIPVGIAPAPAPASRPGSAGTTPPSGSPPPAPNPIPAGR